MKAFVQPAKSFPWLIPNYDENNLLWQLDERRNPQTDGFRRAVCRARRKGNVMKSFLKALLFVVIGAAAGGVVTGILLDKYFRGYKG